MKLKASSNSMDFVSKIVDILDDDIAQRVKVNSIFFRLILLKIPNYFIFLQVNDYTEAILIQTHNNLELFLIENQDFDNIHKENEKKQKEEKIKKEQIIKDFKKANRKTQE